MYIVWFGGGLGNQLFQYSFYCFLQKAKYSVYADLNDFNRKDMHNGFELEKVFGLKLNIAEDEQIKKLKGRDGFFKKVKKRITFLRKNTYFVEKKPYSFDERVLKYKDAYYQGYWQSVDYVKQCEDYLLTKIIFPRFESSKNREIAECIKNENSVSIHIRRGDYLKKRLNRLYGGICTEEYYKRAIDYLKKNIKDPTFFIFSDDPKWVKRHPFFGKHYNVIDWNKGENSFRDMQLMSLCKHNIIANSSFSWWGAWLNKNKKKIVIAPSKMVNRNLDFSRAFPKKWIRIEV